MPKITRLPIKDAFIVTVDRPRDNRGYFSEFYNETRYPETLRGSVSGDWKQVAVSMTEKVNTIRGLHMSPYNKLCCVLSGAIYDVIVDMRKDSPTFLQWCGSYLSEANQRQINIPAHCLHGFFCVEANTRMLYLQGGTFSPEHERDISPFDPLLNIRWPVCGGQSDEIIISEKDRNAPFVIDQRRFPELADRVSPRRVLIIGASSQVGSALVEEYDRLGYAVYGTHSNFVPDASFLHTVEFDLESAASNQKVVDELLGMAHAELVIICSALTAVDATEQESKERAWAINVDGPRRVAATALTMGSKIVVYSTEYVWDGVQGPYEEDRDLCPLNRYGQSKADMERAVLDANPSALILRTTVVYGPELQGKNFVYQLCAKLGTSQPMSVVMDQLSTPTYNRDLALMTRLMVDRGAAGIFNACGAERMGRYDFAVEIASLLGLDKDLIKAVTTKEVKQVAKRPLSAGMKIDKLLGFLDGSFQPRSVKEALQDWVSHPGDHSKPLQVDSQISTPTQLPTARL